MNAQAVAAVDVARATASTGTTRTDQGTEIHEVLDPTAGVEDFITEEAGAPEEDPLARHGPGDPLLGTPPDGRRKFSRLSSDLYSN